MIMPHQPNDLVGFILALCLLGMVFIAGVWDLYSLFIGGNGSTTVSYYLTQWSRQFPIGVFFMGILFGHLLWQIKDVPKEVSNQP